jgi:signal transduction histidine kinase
MSLHFGLPRLNTLRRQFVLALLALVLLTIAAGLLAVGTLQSISERTRELAGELLVRADKAQELERLAMIVERESERMLQADRLDDLRTRHVVVIESLDELDRLVDELAVASDDVVVLSLHQSAQMLRNTVHVVAGRHEGTLRDAAQLRRRGPSPGHFDQDLRQGALAVTVAAKEVSQEFDEDYRKAVEALADQARRDQTQVLALLGTTLLSAWLISHFFLGRRVLARLREVSHHLRLGSAADRPARVPVQGSDEIAEMARAVEQFIDDRGRLAQAQNKLLESERLAAIGQLAAGIAHEINNPVGFVNSNLGTLKRYLDDVLDAIAAYEAHERELPDACRTALASLKQRLDLNYLRDDAANLIAESVAGLQRVTYIVQSLMDFAHVDESGLIWTDLEKELNNTLSVLSREIAAKADIVREYGGIPEVECVPSQINQVFMNLLLNAVQALPERGTITLRTARDRDGVRIEIADNGHGIRPEHLSRVFDPFFTTRPVGQGTGLGLSLAYGIVQKHGGSIEVDSAPGRGSTFRITLPIQHSSAATASGPDGK